MSNPVSVGDDLVERGVEVLSRLSRMKASLTDAYFIAGWVGEARISIREAASQLAAVTQKLEIVRELAAEDVLQFTASFKEMEARVTASEAQLKAAREVIAEIADFDPDGPIDPDTVHLIRIAGAYRRAPLNPKAPS